MPKKRYTFSLDESVVEAFRAKVGKLSPAVQRLMEKEAAPELLLKAVTGCKVCGTNGDHYCPGDVPAGYGAGDEYCSGCDLKKGECQCE